MQPPAIDSVLSVVARRVDWEWPWARANRQAIAANFARRTARQPAVYDGDVLLARNVRVENDLCSLALFPVKYSELLGAIDLEAAEYEVWNSFAMGILNTADNAYVCAVMGPHTANAGKIYFPAGTPDLSDCRPDGSVDMAGSLLRELEEETGIGDGFQVDSQWLVIRCWPALALMRLVRFDCSAGQLAARIETAVAAQSEPELSGAKIVRSRADIDPARMPRYLQMLFNHLLPPG
jgi:hypothetical protein